MHKLLNFFCLPLIITGIIFVSNGILGYHDSYQKVIESNSHTSREINKLYSEKEIVLKDPPISEIYKNKLLVKIRMAWADYRGHHGKVWDYEPGEYYLGMKKGKKSHEKRHGIK